jgi:VanZ family protein
MAAVIFLMSSRTMSGFSAPWLPGADKLAHLTIYGVFGALIARACWRTGSRSPLRVVVLATLLATAYGLSDEVHQRFVPGRQFELLDLLADAVGAVCGALLVARARRSRAHLADAGTGSLPSRGPS